jgi:hypothetical protein
MPDPSATAKANEILRQLRDARHRAGLSFQQLADKHGGAAPTIRSHEVGDRAFTLPGLIEHAGWFGLEVIVRPRGEGPGQAGDWQAGYDQAVADACGAWGVRTDSDGREG